MLERQGLRWGYTFLRTASHLNQEELTNLMIEATEMCLSGEEERKLKSDNFEGKIWTMYRYEVLGNFGGQRFDAELETIHGRDTATFLVSEQTGGHGSGFSRN